jgi:hypothetical protein
MQRNTHDPLRTRLVRLARIGAWPFWGLVALLAAALLTALPAVLPDPGESGWRIEDAGSFSSEGIHPPEYDRDQQPFRWLSETNVLRLPLKRQAGTLQLRLQTGVIAGAAAPRISIARTDAITLAGHDEIRVYSLFVPPALVQHGELRLDVTSPLLEAPGDPRDLGMRMWGLGWRALEQTGPNPPIALIVLALAALALAAIIWRDWAGWRGRRQAARRLPPGQDRGRRVDRLAFWALLLLYTALFSGHYYSFDGMLMFHEARSIFYDHTLTFREPLLTEWSVSTSKYGVGLPLLYLPGLALTAGFQAYLPTPAPNMSFEHIYLDPIYTIGGAPIHLLVVALTAYLVARFCRRLGLGQAAALWSFALFGLGSPALIYARGDFAQPLTGLLWMGGLHAALGFRQSGRRQDALWCALCIGYGLLARPLEGAMLVPAALAIALPHLRIARYTRREWLIIGSIAGSTALAGAITLLVNYARYGQWLTTGYVNEGWSTPLGLGMRGLLVSPARGLVWAFPAVVLAPLGLWALWRRRQRVLAGVLTLLITGLVLSMSMWFMWWGGGNWGPRLILPSVPLLAVLAGVALDRLGAPWAARIGGFVLLTGLAWSLPGVLTDMLAGYSRLVDGNLGSFKGEGVPLIGAWQYLDHVLARSLIDNQTIDILWVRLARSTHGLSLVPLVACLGGSAWMLRKLILTVRRPPLASLANEGGPGSLAQG